MINFTKEAYSRGGEVKSKKYSQWKYNNYFKILDRRWFEMKKLEKYVSGMSQHKFSFALYSLHSLACFWEREDGLWRCNPKSQIANSLFQDLQSQRDNGVSTMITKSIRIHLSKNLPNNEKN